MGKGRKPGNPKIGDVAAGKSRKSEVAAAMAETTETPEAPKRLYPSAPAWLTDKNAIAEWNRLIPDLIRRKKYLHLFQSELARYCLYAGMMMEAAQSMSRRKGSALVPVVKSSKNTDMLSQHYVVLNRAHESMRQLAADLGLNAVDYYRLDNAQFDLFGGLEEPKKNEQAESAGNVTAFGDFRRGS